MALLVDTGILYALADLDDAWHERASRLIRGAHEILLVPVTVLPEVAYLLHTRLGPAAEQSFLESLVEGEVTVEAVGDADLRRALAVLRQHPDIGLVDATVLAVAERLRLRRIATTDRRHFSRVRPAHRKRFELVP